MCVGGEAQVHVFCLKGDHVSFKLLKGGVQNKVFQSKVFTHTPLNNYQSLSSLFLLRITV